jgi:hypothetical protein
MSSHSGRWLALDLFRSAAVVCMIQGHTFTALVHPDALRGPWASLYTLIHGLTAPMFLVGGGLAYGFATFRTQEEAPRAGTNLRVLRRACVLLALGYALQMPRVSWDTLVGHPDALARAVSVGPLQLVGACLLLCESLRGVIGRPRAFFTASGMLAVTLSAVAPWIWNAAYSKQLALPWLTAWLDGHTGSLFPFVPWASFFLIGVVTSGVVVRALARKMQLAIGLCLAGGLSAGLAYTLYASGIRFHGLYGSHEFWHAGPLYLVFRAGLVLSWLGLLCGLEPVCAWLFARFRWIRGCCRALSRHSLVAYVAHLLVLYGTPFSAGLVYSIAGLELAQGALCFAAVMLFTLSITFLWEHFVSSGWLRAHGRQSWRSLLARCMPQVDGIREGQRLDIAPTEQGGETTASVRHGL